MSKIRLNVLDLMDVTTSSLHHMKEKSETAFKKTKKGKDVLEALMGLDSAFNIFWRVWQGHWEKEFSSSKVSDREFLNSLPMLREGLPIFFHEIEVKKTFTGQVYCGISPESDKEAVKRKGRVNTGVFRL